MAEETANKGGATIANYRPTQHFTRHTQDRNWVLVDAQGQSVGRLCTQIANILRGKNKPTFTPHDDVGDFVVVINAGGAVFRGNDKAAKKTYYKHTGYAGHLKKRSGTEMLERSPETVIKLAVKGMIPRGALGNRMMKKLKIYPGAEHPHKAQKPEPVSL